MPRNMKSLLLLSIMVIVGKSVCQIIAYMVINVVDIIIFKLATADMVIA